MLNEILHRFEFYYLILAVIGSVAYYFVMNKLIFSKHVHSDKLVKAMTFNLVLNIIITLVYMLLMFDTEGRIFTLILAKPDVKAKNMLWVYLAVLITSIATLLVGARISLKRKGHKNLKLERTLTSDFVVTAACTAISALMFIISIIMNAARSF